MARLGLPPDRGKANALCVCRFSHWIVNPGSRVSRCGCARRMICAEVLASMLRASKRPDMQIAILRAVVAFTFLGVLMAPLPARAQLNQFEIREPKVEAGEVEVEYLWDYHFRQPRRRFVEAPPGSGDLVFDDNDFNRQRHTLGMAYGVTKWLSLQVAVEAEQARFEDVETFARANAFGELKLTEIELEGTIVLIPTGKRGFGVAALIEHNIALERGEAHQLFLGTALQYVHGPWSATANLYVVKNIGGREERDGMLIKDERLDFQYAAQIKYSVNDNFAVALEGFGVVERLGNSGTKSDERALLGDFDRHLWGPILYYSWSADDRAAKKPGKGMRVRNADADDDKNGPKYKLGAGVLFGLNDNTSPVVLKSSLAVEF